MSSEDRRVLAVVGFAVLLCGQLQAQTPSAPPLGNAASFAVLGGSAVNNSGTTVVTGNLGVSPGSTITGFPAGVVKLGDTFKNDPLVKAAQHDAGILYTQLGSGPCMLLPSLNGPLTLFPGTYCVATPQLTGPITLDGKGDPNAVFIFRMAGTFTTAADSCVLAINGTQPGNVFWQVASSAILGARSAFVGNLLAHDNITLNSGATVFGRLLALTGVVTLDTNNASLCSACNLINLDPTSLPDGTVGALYTQTIIGASGGTDPYTFKVISGALPHDLSLTTRGVLSGTPMEFGTFRFTVAATDSQGCSGERVYTIFIPCPPALSPTTLPDARACIPYEQTISVTCGSGPYIYTADTLPTGLTLDPSTATLSAKLHGTVAAPGYYTFKVIAEDAVTHSVVSRTYTLKVRCNVTVLPETLPAATACASYCWAFTASCGTAPYTFSPATGTLPAGFVFSPTGKLCVTPTTPGRFTFAVTATDAKGCTGSRTYTVAVGSGPITISPPTLPNGIVGVPYPSQTITASCGTAPYTCRVTAGMIPPGLTFANCTISGTPTTTGCFTFSVTVTDANGNSNSIRYTICVTCPITILPTKLPDASVGCFYSQPLTASCATAPYTCTLSDGMLPAGLTLNNCTISGTPATAGSSIFIISLTDAVSNTANHQYTLLINGGVALFPATLPAAELGSPYYKPIIASGGTPPYTFSNSPTLPPGLTFMQITDTTGTYGLISGTPTALGTFNFCITVNDATGIPCGTATQCYTINVIPPLLGGPTLSGWAMLVLSILLAGAGLAVIRRGD